MFPQQCFLVCPGLKCLHLMRSITYRIAERRILVPLLKSQGLKRSVRKRNACPPQVWGCNDMDPVQCKRVHSTLKLLCKFVPFYTYG